MDAIGSLEPAWLTSARGRCDLAQQQEYLDRGVNDFVSTFSEAPPGPPTRRLSESQSSNGHLPQTQTSLTRSMIR